MFQYDGGKVSGKYENDRESSDNNETPSLFCLAIVMKNFQVGLVEIKGYNLV